MALDWKTFTLVEADAFTLDGWSAFLIDPAYDVSVTLMVAAMGCFTPGPAASGCFAPAQSSQVFRSGGDKGDAFDPVEERGVYRPGSQRQQVGR